MGLFFTILDIILTLCVICGFARCVNDNFAFIGCYAEYVGSYRHFGTVCWFLKLLTTNLCCVTSQQSEYLIYLLFRKGQFNVQYYFPNYKVSGDLKHNTQGL